MADGLISRDEMDVLIPASEAKAVADKAIEYHDKAAAAYLINEAANTGEHCVLWQHPMSEALRDVLEGAGYKVTAKKRTAFKDNVFIISGF